MSDNAAIIETTGIEVLSLNRQAIPADASFLELDGTRLPLLETGRAYVRDHEIWSIAGTERMGRKGVTNTGPIRNIEMRSLLVVYGTRDPARTHFLRERAWRVAEARMGTKRGQWGGRCLNIKADTEVMPEELRSVNLWLIGGPQENRISASLGAHPDITLRENSIEVGAKSFKGADLLVGYIKPSPHNSQQLIYIEAGTSSAAYFCGINEQNSVDVFIAEPRFGETTILFSGVFHSNWRL
jgi:hypothetical protein